MNDKALLMKTDPKKITKTELTKKQLSKTTGGAVKTTLGPRGRNVALDDG